MKKDLNELLKNKDTFIAGIDALFEMLASENRVDCKCDDCEDCDDCDDCEDCDNDCYCDFNKCYDHDCNDLDTFEEDSSDMFDLSKILCDKDAPVLIKAVDSAITMQLMSFAEDEEDYIDWEDPTQKKYYISYDAVKKEYGIAYVTKFRAIGVVYFTDKDVAQAALLAVKSKLVFLDSLNKF